MATYNGTAGNDTWTGANVAGDIYNGLAGNDFLSIKDKGVVFNGGDGYDIEQFNTELLNVLKNGGEVIKFDGAPGTAGLTIGYTVAADVEQVQEAHWQDENWGMTVYGNDNAQTIRGDTDNSRPNAFFGAGGNDKLYGYGGTDHLEGGSGADELYGGDGNDTLIDLTSTIGGGAVNSMDAGAGNDTMHAGTGNVISAGSGDDVIYAYNPSGDGIDITLGSGDDRVEVEEVANLGFLIITDFVAGDDVIDLSSLGADVTDVSVVAVGSNEKLVVSFTDDQSNPAAFEVYFNNGIDVDALTIGTDVIV